MALNQRQTDTIDRTGKGAGVNFLSLLAEGAMKQSDTFFFGVWRASVLFVSLLAPLFVAGVVHGAGASISANQSSFHVGSNLSLSATISAGSDAGVASDIYVSIRTPENAVIYLDAALNWTTVPSPIARNFRVANLSVANFYSLVLPAGLASGTYTLRVALVRGGGVLNDSAALLGSGTSTFSFSNQPLILGINTSSAQPGAMLVVSGAGFEPTAMPSVRFTHGSGYALTVPAIAATTTSLTVPAPPLIDMSSGEFSSGSVTIQVTQADGARFSNSYSGVFLNALPSATARPAGDLTLAFLREAFVMAQQHRSTLSGSTRNSQQIAAALDQQLSILPAVIAAVEQAMANPATPVVWGSIFGRSFSLDTNALRTSDRLLLSMLAAQAQGGSFAGTGCALQNEASARVRAYEDPTEPRLNLGNFGNEHGNCALGTAISRGFNYVIGLGTVALALMAVAGAPAYALALPGAALLYLTVMQAGFDFSLASAFNDPGTALDGLNRLVGVPLDFLAGVVLPQTAGVARDLYQGGTQVWSALSGTSTPAPAPAPAPVPTPAPMPSTCTYGISPTSQSFDANGGYGTVNVQQNESNCLVPTPPWAVTTNASWITNAYAGSLSNGQGPAYYYVEPNTSTSPRTGTVTIAGNAHTVMQSADSAANPFQGRFLGSWSGTCPSANITLNGNFTMDVAPSGRVTGSYSGSSSGTIEGTVSTTGSLSAQGIGSSSITWRGTFTVTGSSRRGTGSWNSFYCSGSWSA